MLWMFAVLGVVSAIILLRRKNIPLAFITLIFAFTEAIMALSHTPIFNLEEFTVTLPMTHHVLVGVYIVVLLSSLSDKR